MQIAIRTAGSEEAGVVSEILSEAASWLEREEMPLWPQADVSVDAVLPDVQEGRYILAFLEAEAVATLRLTASDTVFWPEAESGEALYLHRMAVRRGHAGGRVSAELLRWAAERARARGCAFLRLDCEASRLRLRAVYERFGFSFHSERTVGRSVVARYELPIASPSASGFCPTG